MPGASGNIGSEKVAHAKPDGYTLLVQVSTLVMNGSLYKSLPYDPVDRLRAGHASPPGARWCWSPTRRSEANTVKPRWSSAAKAAPGKLTYATPGVGTPHHLSMALFMQSAGIEMLHVPYKGTAGAVTDLLGGRIDFMFLPVHVALQHIQAGKLKAIATGSANRLPQLPDVPTLTEAGATADSVDMWYGVLAPKGTPRDIVERLGKEIAGVLAAGGQAVFEAQGMVPDHLDAGGAGRVVVRDRERWAEVVDKPRDPRNERHPPRPTS